MCSIVPMGLRVKTVDSTEVVPAISSKMWLASGKANMMWEGKLVPSVSIDMIAFVVIAGDDKHCELMEVPTVEEVSKTPTKSYDLAWLP